MKKSLISSWYCCAHLSAPLSSLSLPPSLPLPHRHLQVVVTLSKKGYQSVTIPVVSSTFIYA